MPMVNVESWLGVIVVLLAISLGVAIMTRTRIDPRLKHLIYLALVLRIAGALVYAEVIGAIYDGGDYLLYLEQGAVYAERLRELDLSMFTDSSEWRGNQWWGTQFIFFPVGIIGALLGPSMFMQFLVFAILSLIGLLAFGVAFHRAHPEVPVRSYLRWVLLFPALWFWPSAPGKESLILLGAGLTVLGYCGKGERIRWPLMLTGLLLVFAIRPQVAMVFMAALALAQLKGGQRGWTLGRVLQSGLIVSVSVVGSWVAIQSLGIDEPSARGVGEYMEARGDARSTNGSDLRPADVSLAGIPQALMNIWLRPFPWKVKSATTLLASLEIVGLWLIIVVSRRRVFYALKSWRSHRLLRLAIPFLLLYSVSAGMTMWNLGVIVRQRTLLLPFLFLLLETVPKPRAARAARRVRAGADSGIGSSMRKPLHGDILGA
jgi:hypothetical protein